MSFKLPPPPPGFTERRGSIVNDWDNPWEDYGQPDTEPSLKKVLVLVVLAVAAIVGVVLWPG